MAVTQKGNVSKTWTFLNGDWHEANVAIMGARTHAAWLGSMVFDGARAFEGVTPDLFDRELRQALTCYAHRRTLAANGSILPQSM
jgi:hypothetical protein